MTTRSTFPEVMRFECRACEREFEATGRARMRREYCDEHCWRWANTPTGKAIIAERGIDPPIPEAVYKQFPILDLMARTDGAALAAWHMSCDCDRCKIIRAAYPSPDRVKPRRVKRRPVLNLALGPRYRCGHPRTLANSYARPDGGGGTYCKTCVAAATRVRRLERLTDDVGS